MSLPSGIATVKAVLSGDTVVLVGKPVDGPPPEMTLTLNHILAPKFTTRGTSDLFGYESREFLRSTVIGQQVKFRVTNNATAIGRVFGDIEVKEKGNLAKLIVEAGFATVKDTKETAESLQALQAAAATATTNHRGMYAKDATVISLAKSRMTLTSATAAELLDVSVSSEHAASLTSAVAMRVIVDYVMDGGSMRCIDIASGRIFPLSLAGLLAPRSPPADATNPPPSAPYSYPSRYFSEMRLLHREVDIVVVGIGRGGNTALGSILHPKGDISEMLLRAGLAKLHLPTLNMLPCETIRTFYQAEAEAKSMGRGMWAEQPPVAIPAPTSFQARVVEVLSGDAVVVAVWDIPSDLGEVESTETTISANGLPQEMRVHLSHIRCPRASEAGSTIVRDFAAKKILGKTVTVTVEQTKEGTGSTPILFGSISYPTAKHKDQSLAHSLLKQGYTKLLTPPANAPITEEFIDLLVTEKLNRRAGVEDTVNRVNDVTTDSKKAKNLFGLLDKNKTYKATVEYAFSGSRFKLFLPSESLRIHFSLLDVRCPNIPKDAVTSTTDETGVSTLMTTPAAAIALRARAVSRWLLLQREVSVTIADIDKNGIMKGHLYTSFNTDLPSALLLPPTVGSSILYGAQLIPFGLASVNRYACKDEELLSAEAKAQELKTGIWGLASTANAAEEEGVGTDIAPGTVLRGKLSEIITGTEMYFIEDNAEIPIDAASLGAMVEAGHISRGAIVATLQDGVYCRGKVVEVIKGDDTKLKLHFIDIGHSDVVSPCDCYSLSPDVAALPPAAKLLQLSLIKVPAISTDRGNLAATALHSLCWDHELTATIVSLPTMINNAYGAILYHPTSSVVPLGTSVNEFLVRNGFARVHPQYTSGPTPRRLPRTRSPVLQALEVELLGSLLEAQELAHSHHLRMWEYGDPGDSEDDER